MYDVAKADHRVFLLSVIEASKKANIPYRLQPHFLNDKMISATTDVFTDGGWVSIAIERFGASGTPGHEIAPETWWAILAKQSA